jgi:hypothetical protein
VTGEVAEYECARLLNLELAPARTPGYDAIRLSDGKQVQIKGRRILPTSKPGQRVPKIDVSKAFDSVLLVLLDENFDATAIFQRQHTRSWACILDIAKSVFQVHGVDAHGNVVVRRQLRRSQVLPFSGETMARAIKVYRIADDMGADAASLPIRQGGMLASRASSCPRGSFWRSTMSPVSSLSDKYMAIVGEAGGKDWGVNEAGTKQMDSVLQARAL